MRIANLIQAGKILVFLLVFTGCWHGPVIDDVRNKILVRDGNCNIFAVDAETDKWGKIVRNPLGNCLTNPTWINNSEFVYCQSSSNSYDIHPLVLTNVKTGGREVIYKSKSRLHYFNHFSDRKLVIQDAIEAPWFHFFDIKEGKILDKISLYTQLETIRIIAVLPSTDSLLFQGIDTLKYKDLPRYPSGYIQEFSDSLDDIYLYDIGEDKLIQLTNSRWSDIHPAWSPDGKYIAFASNKERNYDIFIMELESRRIKQLTTENAKDQYPEYSPDGSKIAFVSDRSGEDQVWLMDSDGGNLRQLTEIEKGVGGPLSWNPKK